MTQDPGSGQPMSERMQSLLSRAVEDQLSEQRQLAGALAEFRAQLGRLSSQLEGQQGGGAAASTPQLEQALGAIAGDVREAVRLLGERLDGVGRLVQQRGHDLAEQRAVLEELKAAVEKHSDALGGMTGGLAALPAFGERIDALHGGLGGLADRLRGLEELTAAVGALQQRAEALDTGLRELRQAFSGVAARAAQLPAREDIESIVGRVAESVDGLGGRLARLETSVPSLFERLDALSEFHSGLEDSLSSLGDRLEATPATSGAEPGTADLSVLREDLGVIRDRLESSDADDDDVQALLERLDALQESLLGPDGVAAQVRALVGDADANAGTTPVDAETVETLVAKAVAESEQRLADHVDEAILTLAEALLRRRPSRRTSGLGAVLGAEEVSSASAPVTDDDDLDEDDDEDDDDDDDDEDDDAADEHDDGPRPAWQTPSPVSAADEQVSEEPPGDDSSRKRKPWWRPGG
jgi:hypothetical protein